METFESKAYDANLLKSPVQALVHAVTDENPLHAISTGCIRFEDLPWPPGDDIVPV